MKRFRVRLPIWKAYLYSLAQRYRRYLWINKSMLEFGMSSKEIGLLHGMLHKYLRKETLRKVKAIQYYELVKLVLGSKLAIATKEEIKVANKLFIAYQINTGDLIMELKQIKEFAKEVGMDAKSIKNMDEDELTLAILQNMDGDKAYSDEFIDWYEGLPEELFDEAEAVEEEKPAKAKGKSKGKEVKEEVDYSELIEAIEEAESIDELVEIAQDDDFEEIFAEVDTDTKMVKKLKKAMLAAIEAKQEEPEEEEEEEKPAPKAKGKPAKEEKPVSKAKPIKEEKPVAKAKAVKKAEPEPEPEETDLAEAINDATTAEELKEIADEVKEENPELFKGISFRQGRGKSPFRTDVKNIKKEMLSRLDEGEAEEPEEEETAELEVTAELVNDAVEAEDKEALQEMGNALGIKFSALERHSVAKMSDKILHFLPKEAKKTEKRTDKGAKAKPEKAKGKDAGEESKSIYQVVEEMVIAGEDEKAIVKAVSPVLTERGKNKVQILKWVKQMITVVESAQEEE